MGRSTRPHAHGRNGLWSPPAAAQCSQKENPEGHEALPSTGCLRAAKLRTVPSPCASPWGWRGPGEKHPAELSQRLRAEEEGRRGRRLTHGTWYQLGCQAVSSHQLEMEIWSLQVLQSIPTPWLLQGWGAQGLPGDLQRPTAQTLSCRFIFRRDLQLHSSISMPRRPHSPPNGKPGP